MGVGSPWDCTTLNVSGEREAYYYEDQLFGGSILLFGVSLEATECLGESQSDLQLYHYSSCPLTSVFTSAKWDLSCKSVVEPKSLVIRSSVQSQGHPRVTVNTESKSSSHTCPQPGNFFGICDADAVY